jgi:hypothetical protein
MATLGTETMMRAVVAVTALAVLGIGSAAADEQLSPIAASGDWVAMAHRTSMVAQPDVCAALTISNGTMVGLRASGQDIELRVANDGWSLPAEVSGDVHLAIADWSADLEVGSNMDSWVAAPISQDQIGPLLQKASQASAMTVTVGKAKPITVSLAGSAKVLNAFRTCADIHGGDAKGGDNPFK